MILTQALKVVSADFADLPALDVTVRTCMRRLGHPAATLLLADVRTLSKNAAYWLLLFQAFMDGYLSRPGAKSYLAKPETHANTSFM